MAKCLNCGKSFKKQDKKGNRHIKYCCVKCYWQYHLKDIIKGDNVC